jgi:CDP-diglyceride synthetase
MMNRIKQVAQAAFLGLMAGIVSMAPYAPLPVAVTAMALTQGCAINVGSAVTLVGQLAVNFLNSYAGFTTNPAEQLALGTFAAGVQVVTGDVTTFYNAYEANKTTGTLAALTTAIQAALANLPAQFAALKITNPTVSLAVGLIISTMQIIASFFGVAAPALTASLKVSMAGAIGGKPLDKVSRGDIIKSWNAQVCSALTGPSAQAACIAK